LGVVAVWLSAAVALADGCYIPKRAVRKFPDIPAQRAVLSWTGGVETLVISSALDSEAQKLGWIIPIPSVPQKIEKESPGGLRTLSYCIQPEITHDLYPVIGPVLLVAFVGNLLAATGVFYPKRFFSVVLLVLLMMLCSGLMLPALGTSRVTAARTGNVLVEKTATVGSYDVTVLRPAQPKDLNAWLGNNGFATLPTEADKTVAGYTAQGWVFAAIKLTRGQSGANAPHPIKLVFTAKEAVYPLRLTALARGSPEIELFVIAKDTASCGVLAEEFCDRFAQEPDSSKPAYTVGEPFHGAATRCSIGHPAIWPLLWNDCVLTKLSGAVRAGDMKEDIRFDWKPFHAYRQHFYSVQGARAVAWIVFLVLAGGWSFVSMAACRKRIVAPGGPRSYLGRVLLPAVVLSAVIAGIVLASLPKLAASEVQPTFVRRLYAGLLQDNIDSLLNKYPDMLQGTSPEIADGILKRLGDTVNQGKPRNMETGAELKAEDTPGNFTVEKRGEKVVVRVYEYDGTVDSSEHPLPPAR
jgi:hypothetical protein